MRFKVNFYIHIFKQPIFIVRNWDNPVRDVHLSFQDESHYNSVRLESDVGDTIPLKISLKDIGIESSIAEFDLITTITDLNKKDIKLKGEKNEFDKKDQVLNQENEQIQTVSNIPIERGKQDNKEEFTDKYNNGENYYDNKEKENKENMDDNTKKWQEDKIDNKNLCLQGYILKDSEIITPKGIVEKMLITNYDGEILEELGDFKKCHCKSEKKYKNCCKKEDIHCSVTRNVIYCEINKLASSLGFEGLKKKIEEGFDMDNKISNITKKVKQIFI